MKLNTQYVHKFCIIKFIFNFQMHVGGASVVPWGGAAFNATQLSREELLTT